MPDGDARIALAVTQGGRPAVACLKTGGVGRITALFARSFYVAFDRNWVCLGADTLALGPLNVRTSAPNGMTWDSCGLHMDDRVVASDGHIRLGQVLEIDARNAVSWDPPPPPPWSAATLKAGLDGLERLDGPLADEGLAGFGQADPVRLPPGPVIAAARQPIGDLAQAVVHAFAPGSTQPLEIDHAVIALLGLGPGLTPSGDDFLGGMLIALDVLTATGLHAKLLTVIERHAHRRTNAISLAHLRAAGDGAGHLALHEALNSLLCGDTKALPARLTAIDRIGHSSGRDALAGVCVTLRAFVAARNSG